MKSVRFNTKSIPLVFAIVTILAYGLLLPLTGFYWDDWPFAWIARFLGPAEFIPAFRGFRPFLGPIFFVTTSLIPSNPLLWQIFALLIRFLSGLLVWLALSQVWPRHQRQVADRIPSFPGISRIQPALGGLYTHQPGMDTPALLSSIVLFYGPRTSQPGAFPIEHHLRVGSAGHRSLPNRILHWARAAALPFHLGDYFRSDTGLQACG